MSLDVSAFHRLIVADTCAVWNVLSSRLLHHAGTVAGCFFSVTDFILYECLHKPRSRVDDSDLELQRRLKAARAAGQFRNYSLDVEDLQEVQILEKRKNLSKGELAAIAFAKKTQQAFLTDDQKARQLAATALDAQRIQTTPHLLGWLVFTGRLGDSDISLVVSEHEQLNRPLRPYFMAMYSEALRCRLMQTKASSQ
ncbi:hypothetical protein ACN6A1_06270 [Myxococcus virescens]|uniref:hypothetical protein n=1 Tax=Myxococcus virescens TaxID=83456 RepID=UPI003DA26203